MKKIYWGTFFISCGILFLLSNLGLLNLDFSLLRKLWPVLLIIWGISLMIESRKVKIGISLLSAILVAGVIFAMFDGVHSGVKKVTRWNWHSDLDTIKIVPFNRSEPDSGTQNTEVDTLAE